MIFDVNAYVDVKFGEITKHMDTVVSILYDTFGECEFHAMGISLRSNWDPAMVELAEKLNKYLEIKHEFNVVRINCYLTKAHFVKDQMHLNGLGYRVFMDRCIGHMIGPYYKAVCKSKRGRLENLSKSGIKSLNKKLK